MRIWKGVKIPGQLFQRGSASLEPGDVFVVVEGSMRGGRCGEAICDLFNLPKWKKVKGVRYKSLIEESEEI